jgi:hypothetical protein
MTSTELVKNEIRRFLRSGEPARQVEPLLGRFAPEVLRSAVHSVVLFGWSKFQPGLAPPLEYIGGSSMGRFIAREKGKKATPEELKWDAILTDYQFMRATSATIRI